MQGDLAPEYVLNQLKKGELSPYYLFHGQSEFRLEQVLNIIREAFIPEGARDFNLKIFYGDKNTIPADIIDEARSLPFMSQNRLIIVRRTEDFSSDALEAFITYLDDPIETTCIIFISVKPDFRKKFFKKIRQMSCSINFRQLYDNQVVPWIREAGKNLGINIDIHACAYLQQIVGNRLRDLHSELEKLSLRYHRQVIGINEVKAVAIHSRIYSVFELMDEISFKRRSEALSVLNKFLEEEGKDSIFRVIGMLNRQIRLLWQTKTFIEEGGSSSEVARKLGLKAFQVKNLVPQSKCWSADDFDKAFHLLHKADGLLKSGSHERLVLENVVINLCN